MTNHEIRKTHILNGLKNFFTKNIAVKVVALLFAMLLWGYVLTDLNPYRIKTIPDVATSFDGEAELMAQGLCIRGSREELLQKVAVAVSTRITNYSDLSAISISATVSLKNISKAQEYDIPIRASISSMLGTVQSVTPATVKVEIDTLVQKTIPVSCVLTGEAPEGYWADMEAISSTATLDIQGAKTDISKVSRAECIIDLTGRTSTIFGTFDVVLYDSDSNVVSSDVVVGTLPSSTVRLPIYPVKTVPIDILGSMLGADTLAANFELVNAVATPAMVRILGDQSVLDAIDSMALEPFNVSGKSASEVIEAELIVPEGVRLIEEPMVDVNLDIREKVSTLDISQLNIEVTGLPRGMTAIVSPLTVDLKLEGRVTLMSLVKRGDVKVDVDVTGLSAGTHELPLTVFVRNEETTKELTLTLSQEKVTVIIRGA